MLYTKDEVLLEMLIIERKICYLTNINMQSIHKAFIYLSYKHYCEAPYKNCILDNCKFFSISCIKKVYEFCAKKEVSRQFISDLINLRLKDLCKKYNLDIYNPIKQVKQSILIFNEKRRNIKYLEYEYCSKYCVFHREEYVDFSECTRIKELDEDIDYLFKKKNSSLKHTDKDDYVLKIDNMVKNTAPTRIIMEKTATDRQLEIARKMYPNAEIVRDDSDENM